MSILYLLSILIGSFLFVNSSLAHLTDEFSVNGNMTLTTADGHVEDHSNYALMSSFTFSLSSPRLVGDNKDAWIQSNSTVTLSSISLSLSPVNVNPGVKDSTFYAVLVDSSGNVMSVSDGFAGNSTSANLNFNMDISTSEQYSIHFTSSSEASWVNVSGQQGSTYDRLMAAINTGQPVKWGDEFALQSWAGPGIWSEQYGEQDGELYNDEKFYADGFSGGSGTGKNFAPSLSMSIQGIPEPSTALLSICGLTIILLRRKVNHVRKS